MFHRRGDASGFIARWNNYAKELEGRLLSWRVSHGAEERSSQCGLHCAWLAISSRMDGRSRFGRQLNWAAICRLSITSHGTSNGRGAGSDSIECFPKCSEHQLVSWAREMALAAPPPTLNIVTCGFWEYSICCATSSAKSL